MPDSDSQPSLWRSNMSCLVLVGFSQFAGLAVRFAFANEIYRSTGKFTLAALAYASIAIPGLLVSPIIRFSLRFISFSAMGVIGQLVAVMTVAALDLFRGNQPLAIGLLAALAVTQNIVRQLCTFAIQIRTPIRARGTWFGGLAFAMTIAGVAGLVTAATNARLIFGLSVIASGVGFLFARKAFRPEIPADILREMTYSLRSAWLAQQPQRTRMLGWLCVTAVCTAAYVAADALVIPFAGTRSSISTALVLAAPMLANIGIAQFVYRIPQTILIIAAPLSALALAALTFHPPLWALAIALVVSTAGGQQAKVSFFAAISRRSSTSIRSLLMLNQGLEQWVAFIAVMGVAVGIDTGRQSSALVVAVSCAVGLCLLAYVLTLGLRSQGEPVLVDPQRNARENAIGLPMTPEEMAYRRLFLERLQEVAEEREAATQTEFQLARDSSRSRLLKNVLYGVTNLLPWSTARDWRDRPIQKTPETWDAVLADIHDLYNILGPPPKGRPVRIGQWNVDNDPDDGATNSSIKSDAYQAAFGLEQM